MKKLTFLFVIFCSLFGMAQANYDPTYRTITNVNCSISSGYYHVEKLGGRWLFCGPTATSHPMWLKSIYYADSTTNGTYQASVTTKYGSYSAQGWLDSVTNKLDQLYFNAFADGASVYLIKSATTATKRSFLRHTLNSDYAMRAANGQVKDLFAGVSLFYKNTYSGYIANFPDVYDTAFTTFWNANAGDTNSLWGGDAALAVYPYEIATTPDDADYVFGLKDNASCTGSAIVPGSPHPNMGWFAATMAPIIVGGYQSNNSLYRQIYPTRTNNAKSAWSSYLSTKYGTIAALNTAWGTSSFYTTFGSSAVNTNQTIGTGNGSLQTLSGTLTGGNAGLYSLAVQVSGTTVCADIPSSVTSGTFGGSCTGTINYTTGAYSVTGTFTNAATVRINYEKNGYAFGTGILDEDGRHTTWVGNNIVTPNGTAAFNADLDTFLYQLVKQYFFVVGTALKSVDTNHMVGTPASLGGCARDQVYQAAKDCLTAGSAKCVDYLEIGTVTMLDPANIIKHVYDISGLPIVVWETRISNTDSGMSGSSSCSNWGSLCSSTQASRGTAAAADISALWTAQGTNGDYPTIGYKWWEWPDNPGEQTNFGIVSLKDNAYNGIETITGTVACGYGNGAFNCGGEAANYGSGFLSAVATANQNIDTAIAAMSNNSSTIQTNTVLKGAVVIK